MGISAELKKFAGNVVRAELRRLEIDRPSRELGYAIATALQEFSNPIDPNQSYYIMSRGIRIGKRVEQIEEHRRKVYRYFYYIDKPIGHNIRSRNGIEVGDGEAQFYSSGLGTDFEYLARASKEDIESFAAYIPHPIKWPVAST